MSSTSCRSRRSCIERSLENSPGSRVIGVSLRNSAHCSRVKTRYGLYCCSVVRISMTLPFVSPGRRALLRLARCLFFQPRHAGPLAERRLDLLEPDVARLQQHQQMKQQIGTFGDQMLAVSANSGDDRLDRLLAHLLGALRRTLVEQLARIRR